MAKTQTLLEEIRRIRHRLDREMVSDPKTIRKIAAGVEQKYGIKSLKARPRRNPSRFRGRKAVA